MSECFFIISKLLITTFSLHAKLQLDIVQIGFINQRHVPEITLSFGRFFCENMIFKSILSLDFS